MRNSFTRLSIESLEQRDNPSGWSFWDDTYVGAVLSGVAQGGANLVNGVQDAAIGLVNLPAVVYNNTAGYLGGGTIGYIPSPDWSRDLIVVNDPLHGTSKFLGGTGTVTLITVGVGTLARGGAVVGETGAAAGNTGATVAGNTGAAAVTAEASGSAAAQVAGMGNIGSHAAVDTNTLLSAAQRWLGSGYREIAPGVFRSSDGLRQFRMTANDLLPTHGNIGPHVHFEALNPAGTVIENLHIPFIP